MDFSADVLLYLGSNGETVFGFLLAKYPNRCTCNWYFMVVTNWTRIIRIAPLITAAVFPIYGYKPIILGEAALFMLLAIWAWVFPETKNVQLIKFLYIS